MDVEEERCEVKEEQLRPQFRQTHEMIKKKIWSKWTFESDVFLVFLIAFHKKLINLINLKF